MRALVLAAALAIAGVACERGQPRTALGVAASLRHAMPELVAQYRARAGVQVEVTYGASDTLADQVERGRALDAVVLAEDAALDALIERSLVAADSKRWVASTTLVLVGPRHANHTFAALASLPDSAKVAIGDPVTVPAGRYARRYLEQLGVWDAIAPRVVYGGDVAGVLAHALRGTARVAIVYRTDVAHAAPLAVLDEAARAPAVHIVAGLVARSRHPARARAFLEFLASAEGQAILARHGFAPAS